ncbi:MAG: type II secretion system protein [Lachnospiraceae bacterium]|nr:type II secretion system protein [Lachnospiraceae bacterium]
MMRQFRQNNKGYSLVELVIVVAIMAILVGAVSYGLSFSSGKPADECARKLASCMQHARTATMGKFKTTITIRKDADGIWADETITNADRDSGGAGATTTTTTKIGDAKVNISFSETGDVASTPVSFEFNRGSGALTTYADKAVVTFTVSRASTTKTVEIIPITGKITVQ